ncbi:CsbD family protein [Paenarthrobacter nitroguajacolicus]|uniref:CsbD family protein n=1 Tax=Paenarthrobacter nitroguajacolicus TaxID=211146 RepID=A0A558GTF2_PAENT|nr:CsbD family protein [Paenarthrobacter nitroguajacolicus]TVU60157.1 CsbD family protein [Paenarthrobacter nitroguajacolicus]
MGLGDKIKNATEEAVGKVKEKTGQASGDRDLQAEGQAEQTTANLKQAGEKAKDAAKGVKDSLEGR